MAAPVRGMFMEVQYELVKIILLNVFLSTVIVFLIADIIGLVFNMPLWYVIAAAFIYFLVMMMVEVRKISIRRVEQRNPEMREILRTAKDNLNEDTLMAHALFYEVLEKMRRVSSGTFLDFKKLVFKLSAVFLLAIILVGLAFFNINIQRFDNPFEKPFAAISSFFSGEAQADNADTKFVEDDVFGDPSMAKLGDGQLTATVNPSLDTPDFTQVDPSQPSSNPLADIGSDEQAGFNTQTAGVDTNGLSWKELDRAHRFAQEMETQ